MGKEYDVYFATYIFNRGRSQSAWACILPADRAKIPCVFLLGGKAFVVGAVVGFASSSTLCSGSDFAIKVVFLYSLYIL